MCEWERKHKSQNSLGKIKVTKGVLGVYMCYAPVVGANGREGEAFWKILSEYVRRFENRDHVCLFGDLNAKIGNGSVEWGRKCK